MKRAFLAGLVPVLGVLGLTLSVKPEGRPFRPPIKPASQEAKKALGRIRIPKGFTIDLVAAEPLLANPVAFAIDERGRFYVAETFRHHQGVTDIRRHMNWLDGDLACRTVADRVALLKRRVKNQARSYNIAHDRIRLLEDTNGDGKLDKASVFADGFKSIEAGIGAGVLARNGQVWFTCIPALWHLRDTDGDGKADQRKALHKGFGVHIGYLGHDLHGLVFGPDGKLYFSIGDRGIHVKTPGGTLAYPDTGCVMRCNPDGSALEVYHTGLRNPQELAFDQHGNLFTGDNNSDAGDQAKWIHIVEGGDSGWRIGYQFGTVMGKRGPFMAEELWKPRFKGQASYIVPPIANFTNGPSGLAFYPGVGLPDRYQNHFFLCDFKGGSGNSGIYSFAVEPDGANFQVKDLHQFLWSLLVTDVDFGFDGAVYMTDWVEGWAKPQKGRIYRVKHPLANKNLILAEVRQLLGGGLQKQSQAELARLLAHPHQRIRQEAQFALAAQGRAALPTLERTARTSKNRLARLHAIWGLGQLGRAGAADAYKVVLSLSKDGDHEVRTQAARVLGDGKVKESYARLVELLHDPEARVRFRAAQGLGRLGSSKAVPAVLAMIRENADRDAYLRHAGVMALSRCASDDQLSKAAVDANVPVRRAVLLALRRRQSPELARFLDDPNLSLVLEAARGIHDLPVENALPALAGLLSKTSLQGAILPTDKDRIHLLYRVLNANYRLGKAENARAVAAFAARDDVPLELRLEALRELGDWTRPAGRDRVMGLWRPLPARPAGLAAEALQPVLGAVFSGPDRVRQEAARVAGKLGIKEVGPLLYNTLVDARRSSQARVEALRALRVLRASQLTGSVKYALDSDNPALRHEARSVLAHTQPQQALTEITRALKDGAPLEKQGGFRLLGTMKDNTVKGRAEKILASWLDSLLAGGVDPKIRLDLVEAARTQGAASLKKKVTRYEMSLKAGPLGLWSDSLVGGDAQSGRDIFFHKTAVSCLRCHKINGEGGEVGPELAGIGAKQKRPYILEAIVFPNRHIAKGYDGVLLFLTNGKTVRGVLREENKKEVRVMTAEGKLLVIPRRNIDLQQKGKSAMPEDLIKHLSRSEVRDLVEFLSTLQKQGDKKSSVRINERE